MASVHVLRLGQHRDAFFCPITRLHLTRGGVAQGTVPADADLRHIKMAVRSGGLVDVNGTVPMDKDVAPATAGAVVIKEIKPERKAEAPVEAIEIPVVEAEVEVAAVASEPEKTEKPRRRKG